MGAVWRCRLGDEKYKLESGIEDINMWENRRKGQVSWTKQQSATAVLEGVRMKGELMAEINRSRQGK